MYGVIKLFNFILLMLYFFYNYSKSLIHRSYNNALRVNMYMNHWAKWYLSLKKSTISFLKYFLRGITFLSLIVLILSIYYDFFITDKSILMEAYVNCMIIFNDMWCLCYDVSYYTRITFNNLQKVFFYYVQLAYKVSCITFDILFTVLFQYMEVAQENLAALRFNLYMHILFDYSTFHYMVKANYVKVYSLCSIVAGLLYQYSWAFIFSYIVLELDWAYQNNKLRAYLLTFKFHRAFLLLLAAWYW